MTPTEKRTASAPLRPRSGRAYPTSLEAAWDVIDPIEVCEGGQTVLWIVEDGLDEAQASLDSIGIKTRIEYAKDFGGNGRLVIL